MTRKNYTPAPNICLPYRQYRRIMNEPIAMYSAVRANAVNNINEKIKYMKKNGYHLKREVFIPQYLGFNEHVKHEQGIGRSVFYSKDGFSLMRLEDNSWLLLYPDMKKSIMVSIPNMYSAINLFESLGFDVNVQDYLAGRWFK